jgi:hypothetical protein
MNARGCLDRSYLTTFDLSTPIDFNEKTYDFLEIASEYLEIGTIQR